MKSFNQLLVVSAVLGLFSFSAFAQGMNHNSTEGAICADRQAGKDIKVEAVKETSEETSVKSN